MSLDDVAKVTKIQPRILERLEAGRLEGLPADVFVRGFVRSFARCVGLDEEEALRRYVACSPGGLSDPSGSSGSHIAPTARALVEAMADLVPGSATVARATAPRMLAVEVIDLAGAGPTMGSLAAGSLRDLPASDTLVETMMLPETGTVVMPARAITSLAEEMTDADPLTDMIPGSPASEGSPAIAAASAPAASRTGVDEAAPAVAGSAGAVPSLPDPIPAVAVEPAALIRVESQAAGAASTESARKRRGRRGKGRSKRASGSAAPAFHRNLLVMEPPAGVSTFVTTPVAPEAPAASDIATARGSAVISVVSVAPLMASDPLPSSSPGTSIEPSVEPSVEPSLEPWTEPAIGESSLGAELSAGAEASTEPSVAPSIDEPVATATWAPKMPPIAATPSVPWRRPAYAASVAVVVPSLVIDDADPESAERVLEERAEKQAPRRSFLPPILLDREDRSARQGGLTLAVIILLIAATLTLSYLMRRPSAGGDGMTRLETPAGDLGSPARS